VRLEIIICIKTFLRMAPNSEIMSVTLSLKSKARAKRRDVPRMSLEPWIPKKQCALNKSTWGHVFPNLNARCFGNLSNEWNNP
jgi:hypothetical protein